MTFNVIPTVEVINEMADHVAHCAKRLKAIAEEISSTKDLTFADEAARSITNLVGNLRLDLLITRPLRETMKSKE